MKKWLIALVVASICQITMAQVREVTEDRTIAIPYGQKQFFVALRANATTGFRWHLQSYDHKHLRFLSNSYQRLEPHLMGSPGIQYFTFQLKSSVIAPQCGVIRFAYARPWEHQTVVSAKITWCYKARASTEIG